MEELPWCAGAGPGVQHERGEAVLHFGPFRVRGVAAPGPRQLRMAVPVRGNAAAAGFPVHQSPPFQCALAA